ncbi:DUF1638 domain-containing protein [Thalassobaculum salexigens]|uniref:DUF1638 domain-containing protein n=1 Tax=Thalassobaculum salexigens TaxID=455360 RepID=UPI00040F791C|nr:DUF1638 domain-containing protein [Thalassobaculum salexigens]
MDDPSIDGVTPEQAAPLWPEEQRPPRPQALFIACGALARELVDLKRMTGWAELTITCLPAHWHNTPQKIAPAVLRKIRAAGTKYDRVYVLYGDCGTGGELDRMLAAEGVERIPGPHCYQMFAGTAAFTEMADRDPGQFYLTDYLVRHFDRLIIKGLGLDRYPQLLPDYFGHYTTLVYLAQTADSRLRDKAVKAAERLGLAFEYRHVGYGEIGDFVAAAAGPAQAAE